jgi:hypothetical protein
LSRSFATSIATSLSGSFDVIDDCTNAITSRTVTELCAKDAIVQTHDTPNVRRNDFHIPLLSHFEPKRFPENSSRGGMRRGGSEQLGQPRGSSRVAFAQDDDVVGLRRKPGE